MTSIKEEIGKYLFNLRIKNKLSQKDMAELMKISIPEYSSIEKNRVNSVTLSDHKKSRKIFDDLISSAKNTPDSHLWWKQI